MFNLFDNMMKSYTMSDEHKSLLTKIEDLENRLKKLNEKYQNSLHDIKHLEEENIETANVLYEIMESLRAVDARIDILAEKWSNDDV